jgi:hypothetical protein
MHAWRLRQPLLEPPAAVIYPPDFRPPDGFVVPSGSGAVQSEVPSCSASLKALRAALIYKRCAKTCGRRLRVCPRLRIPVAVLTPDETRIQSENSIRGQQAKAFIDANQMDEAKKIIANIADENLRASLDAAIAAKLPKAGLNGF